MSVAVPVVTVGGVVSAGVGVVVIVGVGVVTT